MDRIRSFEREEKKGFLQRFSFKNLFSRAKAPIERRSVARPQNGYDITILIVDDSKTVVFAIEKLLTTAGFKTLTANNGSDGIELAKKEKPDLILMDVVMPGINGFQATRILRSAEESKNIPIVIISGNQMQTEKVWGERLGANGFLPKPINRGDFFRLLGELLDLRNYALN